MMNTMCRFMLHVEKTDGGCWLWRGARTEAGYGTMFHRAGQNKMAHRVSWELHRGPLPRGAFVRHACDNRLCVNPDHLVLGDHWDNVQDMVDRGRSPHGEKHWNSRATGQQAKSIREEYAAGQMSVRGLAAKHGIGKTAVHAILTGRTWRRAGGPVNPIVAGRHNRPGHVPLPPPRRTRDDMYGGAAPSASPDSAKTAPPPVRGPHPASPPSPDQGRFRLFPRKVRFCAEYDRHARNSCTVLDGVARIELSRGLVGLVDEADLPRLEPDGVEFARIGRWCANLVGRTFYMVARAWLPDGSGTMVRAHRLIMGLRRGDRLEVNHIHRDGLDNRRSELRVVSGPPRRGGRFVSRGRVPE